MVLLAVLLAALVPAVVCDLRARLIPNLVTGPAALAALAAGTALDPGGEPGRLAAGVAAAAFLGAAALIRPEGMGLGDAKLAGVIGLCLGPAVATALIVSLGAGTLAGLGLTLTRGLAAARAATLPFAPFLALGALAAAS